MCFPGDPSSFWTRWLHPIPTARRAFLATSGPEGPYPGLNQHNGVNEGCAVCRCVLSVSVLSGSEAGATPAAPQPMAMPCSSPALHTCCARAAAECKKNLLRVTWRCIHGHCSQCCLQKDAPVPSKCCPKAGRAPGLCAGHPTAALHSSPQSWLPSMSFSQQHRLSLPPPGSLPCPVPTAPLQCWAEHSPRFHLHAHQPQPN